MNDKSKLLIATALLPVLADIVEDIPMHQLAKQTRNRMVASIRSFDRLCTDNKGEDEEEYKQAMNQQTDIQIWFRQILNENFTDND